MKTNLFLLSILICCILSLISCKKNDDDNPVPVAGFIYSGANLPAPAVVSFTNTSTDATSFIWDFGDNGSSTFKDPTHTYLSGGVYTVTLMASGPGGTNSISRTINIQTTLSTCKITSVKITEMSFTDGSGLGWDPFDGPDVFFTISIPGGSVLLDASANRYSNISTSSLPISWNIASPVTISPLNQIRFIEIYDYDTLDPDDFIGGTSFNPSTLIGSYPNSTTIKLQGITIVLGLQWQ